MPGRMLGWGELGLARSRDGPKALPIAWMHYHLVQSLAHFPLPTLVWMDGDGRVSLTT
jgi:hypothetical protein